LFVAGICLLGQYGFRDYLKFAFYDNEIELTNIRKSIKYFSQLERCYINAELSSVLLQKVVDGSLLNIKNNILSEKITSLALYIAIENHVFDPVLKENILDYLDQLNCCNTFGTIRFQKYHIIKKFFEEPVYSYLQIAQLITDSMFIKVLLRDLELDELTGAINEIFLILSASSGYPENWYKFLIESSDYVNCTIEDYVDRFNFQDIYDDLDIGSILSEAKENIGSYSPYEINETDNAIVSDAIKNVHLLIVSEVESSLDNILSNLDSNYDELIKRPKISCLIDDGEIENLITSFMEPDYDDGDDLRHSGYTELSDDFNEVDMVFK